MEAKKAKTTVPTIEVVTPCGKSVTLFGSDLKRNVDDSVELPKAWLDVFQAFRDEHQLDMLMDLALRLQPPTLFTVFVEIFGDGQKIFDLIILLLTHKKLCNSMDPDLYDAIVMAVRKFWHVNNKKVYACLHDATLRNHVLLEALPENIQSAREILCCTDQTELGLELMITAFPNLVSRFVLTFKHTKPSPKIHEMIQSHNIHVKLLNP